ncbi:cation:proton antiporter [Aquisphaera insulae]|uniref:cation:proton antiporter n=1 Tax=Aquisphaera insulae TaxID=2712864 RepID=UPI0013EC4D7B|nr:cation:proton antiporter [Aquisphaera insulae]
MQDLSLLLTLAGGLGAALICGYITFKLGLSPILGYLMAGLVVGPYTPGFTANQHMADQFAEVGVILLMFGVGLQFHVEELLAVRRVAIPGAVGLSLAATILGAIIGVAYGWGWSAGIVFGLALSVASTVVLTRVLAESGDLQTRAGHIAIGWLVVEDLFTVVVLVLMPAIFAKEVSGWGLILAVGLAMLKVAVMVGLTFVLGNRIIPWILDRAARTRSRELFTLTVLAIALGIAVGSVELFDVSVALGAFLAGMVVGRTEFSLRAATEALPMRDAFAVLFFVSVGMLFRPKFLLESPGLIAWTVALVMLAKPLVAFAIVAYYRLPLRTTLSVSLVTGQIGEFSFILATVGEQLGVIDERARNAIVAAAIVSIAANPLIYRLVDPLTRLLGRFLKRPAPDGVPTRLEAAEGIAEGHRAEADSSKDARFRAVIVGYGPVGQTLARLLDENRIEPVIIELNVDTVRRLNAEGTAAIYGDAARRETLENAGVADAVALVIGSSTMQGTAETIRLARELNPSIVIFARSAYLREVDDLRRAGADVAFSGEGEVALAMTESLLRHLRATPDQIDRERARIREELFAGRSTPEAVVQGRELRTDENRDPT